MTESRVSVGWCAVQAICVSNPTNFWLGNVELELSWGFDNLSMNVFPLNKLLRGKCNEVIIFCEGLKGSYIK